MRIYLVAKWFNINDKTALDLGYKYQDFGRVKSFSSVQVPNMAYRTYTGEKGSKIKIHSIMTGIRYSF